MNAEAELIAARLAASPWFPIPQPDRAGTTQRDATAHIEIDGSTVLITVTDPDGGKREYRAVVVPLAGGDADR